MAYKKKRQVAGRPAKPKRKMRTLKSGTRKGDYVGADARDVVSGRVGRREYERRVAEWESRTNPNKKKRAAAQKLWTKRMQEHNRKRKGLPARPKAKPRRKK